MSLPWMHYLKDIVLRNSNRYLICLEKSTDVLISKRHVYNVLTAAHCVVMFDVERRNATCRPKGNLTERLK